jgi:DNA (cytosine-5)-methyltransferase 1
VNVLSLFSGVEGLGLGLERAGHRIVGMCEIDPMARRVLRRHWPDVDLHDDVTTLDGRRFSGRVDLVAGGSPCQDLSVAGRRAGLDGERSGLFWHQCRIAAESAARWVLWENVAGALSSNDGEDFAAVLWGLTGCRPAVPEDGWRTVGVCVGPDRTAVWRLFDARWFGVAQRRRRVFVVAGPRGECGPEILVEPESCGGDLGARPTAGPAVAALTGNGVGTCGADDNEAQAGHLVPALTGRCGNTQDDQQVGQLIVEAAFDSTWSGAYPISDDPSVSPPVKVGSGLGIASPPAVAFSENQRGEVVLSDYAHQLAVGGGKPGQGYPAVMAERWVGGAQQDEIVTPGSYVGALAHASNTHGGHHQPKVFTPDLAVRRLTPRECERLMGWPDDWTRWADDGTEIADSHRYRMCGNGVVSNVTEWIGRRLP